MKFVRRTGEQAVPRLFLSCGLCGQKQVDGMLSRAWWGSVDAEGRMLHACPVCRAANEDWAVRLAASAAETGGAAKPGRARTSYLRVLPGGGERVGVSLRSRGHLQLVRA